MPVAPPESVSPRARRPVKSWTTRLHRWVGLASGVVVFIVSLSGAIYVWEAELFALGNRGLVYVAPAGSRADAATLVAAAQGALAPGRQVQRLTLYRDPGRAAVAISQRGNPEAASYFQEYDWYDEVYLDPASARVLGVVDRTREWTFVTRRIHTSLLLAERGTHLVAVATLLFTGMLLTGLYLWWPRTRAVLATRLRPRLVGPWKRAVFDGHAVLGFYGLLGLLVVALTGPVWTWRWYTNAIAWTLTGEARLVNEPVPVPAPVVTPSAQPEERALQATARAVPDYGRLMLEVPPDSTRVLTVGAVFDRSSLWEEYERYYFHPTSGELLGDERFEEKNLAMKWRNSNYGIHTGTLLGWPMQLAATAVAVLATSLPVTGALVWFPRWRRGRARRR